ncbi:MAG: hypothetical protein ACD_28C00069G0004 [uncultured bacterium]|nr:MAG: hypothetical protein ACD_28C00069G0004 [uncultured bacterium]
MLSVTIDPEKIDVNVHPRKLEVRFSDPQEIFRVVKSTVHSALERSPLTPQWPLHHQDLDTPAFLRKPSIMARERPKVTIEESAGTYDGSLFAEPPVATPSFSDNRGFWGNSRTSPSPSPIESTGTDTFDARKAYLLQKRAERMALQGTPPTQETNPTSSLFQSANFKTNTPPVSSIFDPARAIEVSDDTSESPSFSYKKKINYTSEASPFVSAPAVSIPSSGLQALAQVAQSYIVAQDAEGIVIIDQHAAHERVMLGRLRNNEAAREPAKQSLLAPTHLELDYREKAILEENLDLLNSLGFEIETFGGNTFTVEAVPDFLAGEDIEAIMKGFIDDLLNDQSPMEAHRRHEHILHTIACRAAAKFGKKLSLIEQEALIRSLEGTDDSCACAHGRPTMIRLRFDELEKKFGRK